MNQRIRVVSNRGSHVHHTFQTGFAHMGPVVNTMVQNMIPTSTEQNAMVSHLRALVDRKRMLATKVIRKAKNAKNAEGT